MPAINRIPAFTDTFDSSISGSYDNGPGDFANMVWASGGVIQTSANNSDCAIVRNVGVFSPDQWVTATVNNLNASGSSLRIVSLLLRAAGGADEQCYLCERYATSTSPRYIIWLVDNSFGWTELARTGSGAAISTPTAYTGEAVGSTIRLYEGTSDTPVLTTNDSTLNSGRVGTGQFRDGAASDVSTTALTGGSYFHDVGDYLVGVGPYTSGTGNVTPEIATVASGASGYYPLLLAHSAGGQAIALGTANGFSELANSPSATGSGTAGVRVAAFGNASGAGGSNPVITDPGDHCGALIMLVGHASGLPAVDVTGANQKGSASTSFSISGVTTTAADGLVIPISGRDTDSAAAAYSGVTNANLTGLVELFDAGTTQGNGGGLGIFAGIKASAGATGATTGTVSNSINANYKIAFRAGGGAVELVVADATHGHTVDSPSLTQANTLAVADAAHGHIADSVALSQGFTLDVGQSAHVQEADGLDLTQSAALSAGGSVHGHHADQPALTQAGLLDVADSQHGQYADAITLVQANVLAVADSVHAHAADSPVLSQSQLLAVGDSVHAIATEALELTQAHVLAVESAVHAHIADGVDLSTSGSLGVGSSAHGHAVDQPELVQAAILTIGDSVHALVSAQIVLSQGVVMAIEDAIHAHVSDGVTLSHGAVLAVASAVHLQAAGAIDLTQATTIVVSDSVHALVSQQINLLMPGGLGVPPGRTIVVQAQQRVIVIQPESRIYRVH